MSTISVEKLLTKVPSLYQLVLIGARRASQLSKPDVRPLVNATSKKPTMIALQEILEGKVRYVSPKDLEDEYME